VGDETALANEQGDILEAEEGVVRFVGIFAWPRRKKKALHIISAIACVEADGRVAVWAVWRMVWMSWMGMGLTRLGAGSVVELTGDFVEAEVSGPQLSVCLSDQSEGISNCARSNGFAAG
jgi:hypothetical protein